LTDPPVDPGVVRWRRRPVWWSVGLIALALAVVGPSYRDVRAQQELQQHGTLVRGEVLPSWDGGTEVPVRYPVAGGESRSTTLHQAEDFHGRVGPVAIRVDPHDPTRARLDEPVDDRDLLESAVLFGGMALASVAWAVSRRLTLRRTARLVADDRPAFLMEAVPRSGPLLPRRWRLDLYALDDPPGAPAICTVSLAAWDGGTAPRLVEVRGHPRPGGAVGLREHEGGRIRWPAGRVLVGGRRPRPVGAAPQPARRPTWAWVCLGLGLACLAAGIAGVGEDPELVAERSRPVTATVLASAPAGVHEVPVAYRWKGRDRQATVRLAGPQHQGTRMELLVDPQHPTRPAQPGTEESPDGPDPWWVDLAFLAGIGLPIVAMVRLRSPDAGARSWRKRARGWWGAKGPAGVPPSGWPSSPPPYPSQPAPPPPAWPPGWSPPPPGWPPTWGSPPPPPPPPPAPPPAPAPPTDPDL
jgi:hypothetical protein